MGHRAAWNLPGSHRSAGRALELSSVPDAGGRGVGCRVTDSGGYAIRVFADSDLERLEEITAATFGPVSIDKNMERLLGPFGQGDWRARKVAAIGDDCRIQPDGVFVAVDSAGTVV